MKKPLGCIVPVSFFALFILIASCVSSFAQAFPADAKIKVSSVIATNDTNTIVIKSSSGTVYSVDAFNNGSSIVYVKLYNSTNVTCGQGTPYARYMIPYGASSSGGGFNTPNINGDAFFNAISMCITGGIADNDTSAPPAGTIIVNVHYK